MLLITALLESACSRQGDANSAQGGSDDPRASITGAVIDGATEPRPPGPPMKYEQPPITDMAVFFNTNNPMAFWSRSVNLTGVTVQQVFQDRHFILVGPDKDHALPVQLIESHPEIKPGQKIDLTGVVDPVGGDKTQWNVLPAEQNALGKHSIYIQERSLKLSGR